MQVAEYLSGGPLSAAQAIRSPRCARGAARFDTAEAPLRAGWGYNNSRFIGADAAGLPPAAVGKLHLAWAFEFPGGIRARSQPSIAYGAVYVGSYDGTVYALDRASGCVRWTFKAGAEVRTGVVPYEQRGADGKPVRRLFFGDVIARAYSIDALTGKLAWSIKVDDHPNATITATPTFSGDTIYVPISSLEVTTAADANYECCKFRGAVLALDARNGKPRWKAYAIAQAPAPVKTLASGKRIFAPSGAPIWNSPMVDPKRGVLVRRHGRELLLAGERHQRFRAGVSPERRHHGVVLSGAGGGRVERGMHDGGGSSELPRRKRPGRGLRRRHGAGGAALRA